MSLLPLNPPSSRLCIGSDWHWHGLPGGELQSLKSDGGDGIIRPALRIWQEKVKTCGGLAGRTTVQAGV